MSVFKLAFRNAAKKPALSLMVLGMLALGIAGNVAIFSIYNGMFLRPLPFAEAQRLVDLDETAPKWNLRFVGVAHPDFYAWRQHNATFDSMAFFSNTSFNLSGQGVVQRLEAARVTADMLKVLKLRPALGRDILPEEDRPGGAKVALLGQKIWREQFAGDRKILGHVLKLDNEAYTVIGVLPREAVFPFVAEIWVPLAADPKESSYYLNGVGRLKPGVTLDQARADLTRIHRGLVQTGRKENRDTSPALMPLNERYLGDFRPAANVLLGAVAVVLLIACGNIAGLMMVRAATRSRELAIRTALGASRGNIFRQLLAESLLYAGLGGLAGVLLGKALLAALLAAMPQNPARWLDFSMDYRALGFAVAITGLAALLFGIAPALQAARTDLRAALHDAARGSASRGRRTALSGLVVGEIGLAMLLLVTAALLFQALRNATRVDPGFRAQNVLTYSVSLPQATYSKDPQRVNFVNQLVERMRALPGVTSAAAAQAPPLSGHWGIFFEAEGAQPLGPNEQNPVVLQVTATPGYLETIGVALLKGRQFTERDGEPATRAAIVSQAFARRFFPNADPIGKRIRYPWKKDEWIEIVGLARDIRHYGLDQEMRPTAYVPYRQWVLASMTIVLKTAVDPGALVAPARQALRQMDPDLPMFAVTRMSEAVDRSLWSRRFYSWLAAAFAVVAVLLAAGGIYGVISYAVGQRRQEIGIRMALGAPPARVMGQVIRQGLVMLAIGVPLGAAAMLGISGFLENLLFGVRARDPLTYAAMAAAIAGIALAANLVPARRAAAVAPMEALRSE